MPNLGRHEREAMTGKDESAGRAAVRAGRGRQVPVTEGLACPKCQGAMKTYVRGGLVVELCEDCRGIFLDQGELERLIDAEGGGWSGIVADPVDPAG